MKPGSGAEVLRISAGAVVLAAILLVPFWNKPYTIDDPTFLAGAAHVLRDPLHPTAFEMVWTSPYRLRASVAFPNSPVMYWLLTPVILGDGAEWIAHLIQLLMFACGICATTSLALRLGLTSRQARWAALLLAATPAAAAMAGTAMPDIPAMTLGVLSMERFLAWRDSHRVRDALLVTLLLMLAILSRGHMILLVAVGACLAGAGDPAGRPALRGQANRLPPLLPLLLAPLLAFALLCVTRDPVSSAGMYSAPLTFASWHNIAPNLVALLVNLALALPLTIPWLIERYRQMPWRLLWIFVPAAAAAYLVRHPAPKWTAGFAILTVLVLADILIDAWTRRDRHQLFLAAWLFLPLPVLPYQYLPPKFLVAAAPAAAILVAARARTGVLVATVAAGALLAVLILHADARLAGLWRDGAARFVAPHVRAGERVWFAGSWGFYWYAERAGARPLSWTPPQPSPGDIVVTSSGALRREIEVVGKHTVLESWQDATAGGRIFGGVPAAGFYNNGVGNLPWSWGSDVLNRFEVWRVE